MSIKLTNYSEIWPALIIGIGGTGSDTVRMAKYRMQKEWERLHEKNEPFPGIIQFLAIDTTLNTDPGARDADTMAPLSHDEYAYLGGFSASTVLAHLDNHPLINRWWPSDAVSRVGRIHSGARQMRIIGRIAFYRRYRTFWQKLMPKLYEMTSIRHIQAVEDVGHKVPRGQTTRHIYIVSSLLGGTGAGMLLDVAHRLRAEFNDNAFITAILYMPSILLEKKIHSSIQKARIKSNAYATLKEIEYFQSGNPFRAQYPGENQITTSRPFDRIYLLERENLAGESLEGEKSVQRMAADFIYLETMTKLGSEIRERDVNISSESFQGYGSRAFSSFGVSILDVKTGELKDYVAYQLDIDTLRRVLGRDKADKRAPSTSFNEKSLKNLEDVIDRIISSIYLPEKKEESSATGLGELVDMSGSSNNTLSTEDRKQKDFVALKELLEKSFYKVLDKNGILGLRGIIRKLEEYSELEGSALKKHESEIKRIKKEIEAVEGKIKEVEDSIAKKRDRWVYSFLPGGKERRKKRQQDLTEQRNKKDGYLSEKENLKNDLTRQEKYVEYWIRVLQMLGNLEESTLQPWQEKTQQKIKETEKRARQLWETQDHRHRDHITSIVNQHYAQSVIEQLLKQNPDPELEKIIGEKVKYVLNSFSIRKRDKDVFDFYAEYYLNEAKWEEAINELNRAYGRLAKEWISTKMTKEYDILSSIEEHWDDSEQRIGQFIQRSKPFWRVDLDTSEEADPTNLEDVKLVAINDSRSKSMSIIEKADDQFDPVNTGDPRLFAAVWISHGLNPRFIKDMDQYYAAYCRFKKNRDIPIHLDKRWTDMPDIIISKGNTECNELKEQKNDSNSVSAAEETNL